MKNVTFIFFLIFFLNSSIVLGKSFVVNYPSGTQSVFMNYSKNIIIEMYKRVGISIKLKKVQATRSLILVNIGKADSELLRVKGVDERFKNLIRVDFPILKMTIKAITLNPKIKKIEIKNLRKYSLAFHRGAQLLEKLFKDHKQSYRLTTSNQVYKMVKSKRVDYGVIIDELSGHLKNKDIFKDVKKININFPTVKLYHYINRKHILLVPKLLKALTEMKEQNIFQQLKKNNPQ